MILDVDQILENFPHAEEEKPILRDLFAMAALAGLTASGDCGGRAKLAAMEAYEFADAMLAAREENEE